MEIPGLCNEREEETEEVRTAAGTKAGPELRAKPRHCSNPMGQLGGTGACKRGSNNKSQNCKGQGGVVEGITGNLDGGKKKNHRVCVGKAKQIPFSQERKTTDSGGWEGEGGIQINT